MTLEQLKENLENGRKWLERKGFQCDGEIWVGPDGLTIHEPAMLIESCVRECMEEEKPWTCFANHKDINAEGVITRIAAFRSSGVNSGRISVASRHSARSPGWMQPCAGRWPAPSQTLPAYASCDAPHALDSSR